MKLVEGNEDVCLWGSYPVWGDWVQEEYGKMDENRKKSEYIAMTNLVIQEFKAMRKRKILMLIFAIFLMVFGVALAASMEINAESMNSLANMAMALCGVIITVIAIPQINLANAAVKTSEESLQNFKDGRISIEDYEEKHLGQMAGFLGLSKENLKEKLWAQAMGENYKSPDEY